MSLLELVAVAWLVAGIGTAAAGAVWYTAQRADVIDIVDVTFIVSVALVAIVVWPIVLVAVAAMYLLRRLQPVSYPGQEANG